MEITDSEGFTNAFNERYFKNGFGFLNKSDFEILVFDLLREFGSLNKLNNYDASIHLQIPETKVRKLAYEADLRYKKFSPQDISKEFFKVIAKAKFRGDNSKIQFVIENRFLRTAISSELKKLGHFSDSSFNSEIVSIHIDSFIDLLEKFYPKEAIDRIVEECKDSVSGTDGKPPTFKEIVKSVITGTATNIGKGIFNLGEKFFSGEIDGSAIIGYFTG
jgi:hypothetical protein